ncbi:MAG: AAA family ATPase [Daejeonella sp.]
MKQAFQFGKIVGQKNFINRKLEIERLHQNFLNRTHTILISPRRWGKSSLVKVAAEQFVARHGNYRLCYIDLFEIRSEKDFYEKYSKVVLGAVYTQFDDWIEGVKKFLSKITPKIRLDLQQEIKFDMALDIRKETEAVGELLDLPERLAVDKGIELIICLDEFQNIAELPESMAIQRLLRSVWQKHQHVTYCLYGSKQHMLADLFNKKSMPFFKFGDLFYLEKISPKEWINYICRQFRDTGKTIAEPFAGRIVTDMDQHSYYVQQLSYYVWTHTEDTVDEKIYDLAVTQLLQSNTILFQKDFESLSRTQVNFLRMLLDGVTEGFTRGEILERYELGTSANVAKIIPQLEKKEIVETYAKKVSFSDPAFALWLKQLFS